jgi:hypothetical protein
VIAVPDTGNEFETDLSQVRVPACIGDVGHPKKDGLVRRLGWLGVPLTGTYGWPPAARKEG